MTQQSQTQSKALADLKEALESVDIEAGCTIFNHTPEEIGLMVMENRMAMLTALSTPAAAPVRMWHRPQYKDALATLTDAAPVGLGEAQEIVAIANRYQGETDLDKQAPVPVRVLRAAAAIVNGVAFAPLVNRMAALSTPPAQEVAPVGLREILLICEEAAYACGSCKTDCGPVKALNEIHECATAALQPPPQEVETPARTEERRFVLTDPIASADEQDEDGRPVWYVEVQTVGGWSVVATVWGGSTDEASDRGKAVLRALTATPADAAKSIFIEQCSECVGTGASSAADETVGVYHCHACGGSGNVPSEKWKPMPLTDAESATLEEMTGNPLLATARRNIRTFINNATFRDMADRDAALACVDVLEESLTGLADLVTVTRSAFDAACTVADAASAGEVEPVNWDEEGHTADAVRDALLAVGKGVISFDKSRDMARLIIAHLNKFRPPQPSGQAMQMDGLRERIALAILNENIRFANTGRQQVRNLRDLEPHRYRDQLRQADAVIASLTPATTTERGRG